MTEATAPKGAFLRMRPRLWREKGFENLSHSAMGLYFRLHSYLDDRENDRETGWEFRDGDLAIVSAHALDSGPRPKNGDAPHAAPLAELLKMGAVKRLEPGRYLLADVQARPHPVREAGKEKWRLDKIRQRGGRMSEVDTPVDSG